MVGCSSPAKFYWMFKARQPSPRLFLAHEENQTLAARDHLPLLPCGVLLQIRPVVAMALRYAARSVGVPSLRRASGARVSPSAGSGPLAYHSQSQLGHRLGAMIVASRKMEHHVMKELGRLFWEERKNTDMYGEKELEEILATIKALSEPTRESVKHA